MPTALIVEDEPEANQLLAMLVKLKGYSTVSAYTGRDGLTLASRARPDLVFLDLMLPDLSGYEVCQCLKVDRETTMIPVIMVTARLAAENRTQGFQVGATEYLPKPYTPDQIFRAMAFASDWQSQIDANLATMAIPLNGPADPSSLRGLSRLRSLLLVQGALSEPLALRLDQFLLQITNLVASGSSTLFSDQAGPTLNYSQTETEIQFWLDQVELATLERLGHRPMSNHNGSQPKAGIGDLISAPLFDKVEWNASGSRWRMEATIRLEPSAARP